MPHQATRRLVSPSPIRALSVLLLAAFAANASAVTIDTVPVANDGNLADTTGFGAVAYDYRIGTTEVTNAQYTAFLNAKAASDPLGLYDPSMSSGFGGILRIFVDGGYTYATKNTWDDRPVAYVGWYDAIRFANWLHNGQGNGDTETGAYTLLGGGVIPSNAATITRESGATWFLTSEDEWYKAAYYDGGSDTYFDYPTSSDTAPVAEGPPGGSNSANYDGVLFTLTVGGADTDSSSPYGTFDRGGNVAEWTESLTIGTSRALRGGSWNSNSSALLASQSIGSSPVTGGNGVGFRVATVIVPESSTLALAGIVAIGLLVVGGSRVPQARAGRAALVLLAACSSTAFADRLFIDPQFSWTVDSNVHYTTSLDGDNNPVELHADIYEPIGVDAPHGLPAIVLMHGGGFKDFSKTTPTIISVAEAFAARGYVAVSIDYRLLDDMAQPPGTPLGPIPRPTPLHALNFAEWGVTEQEYMNTVAAAIEDHSKAFSWLVANATDYGVNPDWLASGGFSAGAASSLALATGSVIDGINYPDIKAVLSLAGAMYGYEAGQFEAGAPGIYFVHGTEDEEAPFSELEDYLLPELDSAGVPYEALIVPGADHVGSLAPLANQANQKAIFEFMAEQIGIPEPSSVVLMLIGCAVLGWRGVLLRRSGRRSC